MSDIQHYWGFVLAALALNITPGADTVYILSRTLAQGTRAGVAAVLGISSGVLVWGLLVSFGLAALLTAAPALMLAMKLVGAAYIVWIACAMWQSGGTMVGADRASAPQSVLKHYRQGVLTNLLNPKVGLFFIAFLPQFVVPAATSPKPFLLLTATFIVTGTLWCLLVVALAGRLGARLRSEARLAKRINRICAAALAGMGLSVGLSSVKEVL